MNGYRFKARDPEGKRFHGVIQATSAEEAERSLAKQGLIPVQIKPEPLDRSLKLRRTPTPKAMVQFYRQFATLQSSAVPLLLSLEILQGLTSDRPLRGAISAASSDIQQGSTLADALRRHPRVFSDIAISVIAAGEEGGSLDSSLDRLAFYEERAQQVRDKVRGAMIYPGVIVTVAIGAIAALLTLVVPTFEGMFAASGQELPFATLVLVNASDFLAAYWPYLTVATLLGVLAVRALYDTAPVRMLAHRIVLRMPVAGRLVRKVAVARLSRTLASLLTSGVSILDALTAGARTAGNLVIENAILESRDGVARGQDISVALSRHAVLPPLMSGMVGVGEQTGQLDQMLAKVADFYEREVESEVEGLLKALEPVLVVVVGVALGGIVAAMYLPIFDAIGAVDPIGP